MKRIFCTAMLVAFVAPALMAQTVKKTKEFITANDWVKAKESADGTFDNPKVKKEELAEAWYLKAKIYSTLSTDKKFLSQAPADGRMVALNAIKKAMELDKEKTQTLLTMDQFAPVITLYSATFQDGVDFYGERDYKGAFEAFKNTSVFGDYIFNQGWALSKIDTTVVFYTGLAALNGKMDNEAIKYFLMLADAKVGQNPDFATVYQYLAKHFYDEKDESNFTKYVTLGRQLYPNDQYLPLLELDNIRDKGDKNALFAKYEEIINSGNDNIEVMLNYTIELSEVNFETNKARPTNYDENCSKIERTLKRIVELKPENTDAQIELGRLFINMASALQDEARLIKGSKPEDVNKRNALNEKVLILVDKSIEPLENVFNTFDKEPKLKTQDRSKYKSAVNMLLSVYEVKKNDEKTKFYQSRYDNADKKQ